MFRLADGRLLPFEKSPDLCWQCHQEVYYAWKAGGHYDPTKRCTDAECHDPHKPELPMALPPVEIEKAPPEIHVATSAIVTAVTVVLVGIAAIILRRVLLGRAG